jgi:hypothetical protein
MAGEGKDGEAVGTAEAVIERLTYWDTSQLAGVALGVALLVVERLFNAVYALSAKMLDDFERDGGWTADGALSAAHWLAERTGTPAAALRSRGQQGAALRRLPSVAELARAGRLAAAHLDAISGCAQRHPKLAFEDQQTFVKAAETLDGNRFGQTARRWLDHAAAIDQVPIPAVSDAGGIASSGGSGPGEPAAAVHTDGAVPREPDTTPTGPPSGEAPGGSSTVAVTPANSPGPREPELFATATLGDRAPAEAPTVAVAPARGEQRGAAAEPMSRLFTSRGLDGCLRLSGWFAPADADLLDAALDAGVDRQLRAAADGDPSLVGRPVGTLRAGALLDLVAQSMRREPSELSAPDRYRVAVIVQAGQTTVPPEAACDSVVYRAVLNAASEVLDIGRQSPRWPSGIRRAITLRDRGCVYPGCDRPPSWADIHHCTPFSEQGTTSVDNGALLCRRHHGFVHARGWRVTIDHGKPIVRRPDGEPHTVRRWQAGHVGGGGAGQAPGRPSARPPPPPVVNLQADGVPR